MEKGNQKEMGRDEHEMEKAVEGRRRVSRRGRKLKAEQSSKQT